MAWVWSLFLWIKKGPQTMLIFHLTMYWGGLFLIWFQSIRKGYKIYPWIPLLGFLPPLWSLGGNIWKDMGLGYSLVLTIGLFFCWTRRRNWLIGLIYLLLFYATAVRKNGLAATLPFFVLGPIFLFSTGTDRKPYQNLKLAFSGLITFTATIFLILGFENLYLKAKKEYWGQTVLLYDLAYIGLTENIDLIPPAFRSPDYSKASIARGMSFRELDRLIWYDKHAIQVTDRESDLKELSSTWIHSVFRYPSRYLKLRIEVFKSLLNIGYGPNYWIYYSIPKQFSGLSPKAFDFFYRLREDVFKKRLSFFVSRTYAFKGWFYLLISLVGSFFVSPKRNGRYDWLVLICFSSAILYSISYFPAGVASHFRYLWPVILLAPLGWIFSIGLRDKLK